VSFRRSAVAALLFATSASLAACAPGGAHDDPEGASDNSEGAVTTTVLVPTTSIATGASKTGVYTATVSGELTFKTAGTGDIDLYLRKGSAPTTATYDAASEGSTATETAKITVVAGDKVYYLLYGYSAGSASLSVTVPDAPVAETTVTLVASTSTPRASRRRASTR
jgi:hypothetical protein